MLQQRIQIPNNWSPREYQRKDWEYFENGGKRGVIVAHRRYGKDDLALRLAANACIDEPATYWHMLPKATQVRKAIWLAVNPHTGKRRIDEAFPPEIRVRTNDNEMFIETITGSFWHCLGSDNYDNHVGAPPKGIIFSEWSLCDPNAWSYLEPILLENGGWAAFIYTSRGDNHGHSMYKFALSREKWHASLTTVDETNVFDPEDLEEARLGLINRHGEEAGNLIYNQEYHCSFEGGMPGSYYSTDLAKAKTEGRITDVPYETGVPVRVYFDLGNAPNLVMWFRQDVGLVPHIIDYENPNATGVDAVVKVLQEKRYNYGELILPHDGGNKQMGDLEGRTYKQILEKASGIKTRVLPRADILPGREAAYGLIRKMVMDKTRCEKGLNGLNSYRREWDDKKKKYSDNPLHDWASHDADGFRYMAIDEQTTSSFTEADMMLAAQGGG